jgi:hypothetical protein
MKVFGPIVLSLAMLAPAGCVSVPATNSPLAKYSYEGKDWKFSITVFPDSISEVHQYANIEKEPGGVGFFLAPGEAEKIVTDLLAQGVADWLPDYGESDGIIPGPEPGTTIEREDPGIWHLTIEHKGKKVVSSGRGMYPSDEDPKKAVELESSDRYKRMASVFHAAMIPH